MPQIDDIWVNVETNATWTYNGTFWMRVSGGNSMTEDAHKSQIRDCWKGKYIKKENSMAIDGSKSQTVVNAEQTVENAKQNLKQIIRAEKQSKKNRKVAKLKCKRIAEAETIVSEIATGKLKGTELQLQAAESVVNS